jgi:hypothetical protein
VVFSMRGDGRTYWLRVSDAWLVSSTHVRVDDRLKCLQVIDMLREHSTAYVDVTANGHEVLTRF